MGSDDNTTLENTDTSEERYTKAQKRDLKRHNKTRAQELLAEYGLNEEKDKKLINLVKDKLDSRKMLEYGSNNLAAGPDIYDAEEIIVVEGRADIINLMKMGIDNTIAVEGTNVPSNVIHLCNSKTATVFLDGDRGGDSILKEFLLKTTIEYIARAPEGREVEHLDMDEVVKALDNKKKVLDAIFIKDVENGIPHFGKVFESIFNLLL